MSVTELKTIINCQISFSIVVTHLFPIESQNSSDFHDASNTDVIDLKENLSDSEYKKFDQIIAETLF